MVSTPLKNIRQHGNLPQAGVKIKNLWNHHPVVQFPRFAGDTLPMVRHSVWLFSAKWVPVRVTTLVETAVVPYKKEPEPHKWSHHYNLGLSRMTKYMYIYKYVFTYIYISYYIHISQMFDAICPSTGSQWKAKVFFRGPLTTLTNDDFSTWTRVWATTSKSNVVELVQKDNMTSPFHGVTSGCGLRCKIRKTWLFRLGYRLSHQKKKTTPLGYPNVHHFNRTSCWWP